ncbi:unnamed protein product, partial [Choristocarpus tenellus]
QSIPVYARRLQLTVTEDEEDYFHHQAEGSAGGPLDLYRRDWVHLPHLFRCV